MTELWVIASVVFVIGSLCLVRMIKETKKIFDKTREYENRVVTSYDIKELEGLLLELSEFHAKNGWHRTISEEIKLVHRTCSTKLMMLRKGGT